MFWPRPGRYCDTELGVMRRNEGLRAGVAQIEPAGTADLETAHEIGQRFPDQDFSIVDRTSFAVMQRLGIQTAASFDNDFAVFRFGRNLDRAFTVMR